LFAGFFLALLFIYVLYCPLKYHQIDGTFDGTFSIYCIYDLISTNKSAV